MMTKDELKLKNISAISLGCDKNKVDLEKMLYVLQVNGFTITADIEDAQIIIVNTCAFIAPSIQEAIENINIAIQQKVLGKAEKIIVSGCFPMRDMKVLKENFPEVDRFITLKDNINIINIIEEMYEVDKSKQTMEIGRVVTNSGKYAYLKIADGCSNGCSYCTIPRIRGRFISIPMKGIIKEAKFLAGFGYKELIIVAQDTARYGEDLYGEPKLIELLENLCKIKGIEWIRLHYIYPQWVTEELLNFISTEPKMCKYLDIPLQHIDDEILKSMNRKCNEEQSRELVLNIKHKYPEIAVRSTFIVGYPGETRAKFKKLCNFISEGNIELATFFPYYREEKTKAYFLHNQVCSFIKKLRLKKIQKAQNIVINNAIKSKIGTITEVLIDEFDENLKIFKGHSKNYSPNVDLCVIIDYNQNQTVCVGDIVKVKLIEQVDCGFKGEIL